MDAHKQKIRPFTYNPAILSLLRDCVFGPIKKYKNEKEMNRLISFLLLHYFPLEKNIIISPYRTGDYNDNLISYIVEEYVGNGEIDYLSNDDYSAKKVAEITSKDTKSGIRISRDFKTFLYVHVVDGYQFEIPWKPKDKTEEEEEEGVEETHRPDISPDDVKKAEIIKKAVAEEDERNIDTLVQERISRIKGEVYKNIQSIFKDERSGDITRQKYIIILIGSYIGFFYYCPDLPYEDPRRKKYDYQFLPLFTTALRAYNRHTPFVYLNIMYDEIPALNENKMEGRSDDNPLAEDGILNWLNIGNILEHHYIHEAFLQIVYKKRVYARKY